MTQFAFLQTEFPEVFALARKAEMSATTDARGACFHARLALEAAVKWMYSHDRSLRSPYDTALSALIHEGTFRALVGNALVTKARIIKDYGNAAAHETRAIRRATPSSPCGSCSISAFAGADLWARGEARCWTCLRPERLPRAVQVEASTLAKLQALAKERANAAKALEDAEAARIQSEADAKARDAEIAQLQAEIAAIKSANAATPDTHDYNEEETRDTFIDLLLREAGWPLDQLRDREFPVTGMPNTTGEGLVDYVLWGDDGLPLAVIEAKRTRRDARVGQQQRSYMPIVWKNSSECARSFSTPMAMSTGCGMMVAIHPRAVHGFLKKDELELWRQRRSARRSLSTTSIDGNIVERYYQTAPYVGW